MIGVAVPISVALDNLLLAVVLLGAIFNARIVWRLAVHHPVARAAWLLFLALALAMSWGATPLREAAGILGKYIDLAFIPLFMLMLAGGGARRWAQHAFLAAMGLTLSLSFLVGLKILPLGHWMSEFSSIDNPVIFHSHITQNNMMAFAAFLALLNAREAVSLRVRLAWGAFVLLAVTNVLFMVQGRTGYGIMLVLLGWFAWATLARRAAERGREWGWRQGAAVGLTCVILAVSAYLASPRLHERVSLIAAEYQAWQKDRSDAGSSTGQRLNFYSNTLQIVADHPLLGVGTGGFPAAYAQQTQGMEVMKTHNPHNEYLMIAVQTGVVGLALLLYLFYTQWRYAPLLPSAFEQDAARGLVLAYALNCGLNSSLLDHADGLFFAFMTAVLFAGMKREKKHG
ncbi:MAG TPA: O-antigen ligase family protein [Gallionella sp.]|nr:O-antigen ligase family protein [Gallionella sp.]